MIGADPPTDFAWNGSTFRFRTVQTALQLGLPLVGPDEVVRGAFER
jgi:hypothetical protein